MDSVTGFLVKSKVTSEVKDLAKGLGLDDGDTGADEERRKREAEHNYQKQQAKTDEKMKQIEAEHAKKQEVREKKRDEMRNKYGIGSGASADKSPSSSGGAKPPTSKTGDKCKVS